MNIFWIFALGVWVPGNLYGARDFPNAQLGTFFRTVTQLGNSHEASMDTTAGAAKAVSGNFWNCWTRHRTTINTFFGMWNGVSLKPFIKLTPKQKSRVRNIRTSCSPFFSGVDNPWCFQPFFCSEPCPFLGDLLRAPTSDCTWDLNAPSTPLQSTWLKCELWICFVSGSVSKPCTPGEHQNSW